MLTEIRRTGRCNLYAKGTTLEEVVEKNPHVSSNTSTGHLMEDMIPPRGIIGLLEIKENSKDRFPPSEGRSNTGVETSKRICGATCTAKAELRGGKETLRFKMPHQSVIYHSFEELTDTAR